MAETAAKYIMIVEDDQFLARALTSKLKKEGFKVKTLRDGEGVIQALKKTVPDMLLLDLVMPRKDGFAVLEEIRRTEGLRELPVLVLSNLSQPPDTGATKELGVLDHLIKAETPLAVIVKKIKRHLA